MKKELVVSLKQECWSLVTGITYAQVSSWYDASYRNLKMSIIMPKRRNMEKKYPLIVWICGGAFQVMDQNVWIPQWTEFARQGYIVASVEYRTENEAAFPAALRDVKAAVRYLRAHAEHFGIDSNQVIVAGESAGGCLAALLGVYGKNRIFDEGEYLEQSSEVQGVIDYYGLTEFWMKGRIDENLEEAGEDCIGKGTPPFLILHGDRDELVEIEQSQMLYEKLCKRDVPVEFYILKGCGHGADEFYQAEIMEIVKEFIKKCGEQGKNAI